ncbi:aspartate kinase [Aneurinibacillus terranovensis]|uniref:aspartate kinase n=1 Tax=Aneurinibacillus terranovensis TaxID=278991 RepID=UPI000422AADD|nr:aspartate kinase [Aneurinibacillus terranovensis]
MKILVQKFGGSSLTTVEKRERAIHHILRALEQGFSVCVVVSAMGRKGDPYATDTLLDLIKENGNALEAREMDMLLSCGELISAATLASMLNARERKATVLTGGQAGILTNEDYTNAQIITINPQRIIRELEQGRIAIVTGFQGRTLEWDTTTLGRGGSDTSATALGVALKAEMVDIFTDVEGIMTADPRIVKEARPLSSITYSEICNMAYQGAKVIHPRAVEIAMQTNIPIRVRSTFSDDEGTLVTSVAELDRVAGEVNDRLITAIAHVPNVTQIKVLAKEGQYDLQMKVFKAMAENGISVDFINVNIMGVVYTVRNELADKAIGILREMGYEPHVTRDCAKVSTIGAGMAGVPGVMARIVEALTKEEIQILQSADSHTTIWALVKEEDMVRAVRALHKTFDLDKVQY